MALRFIGAATALVFGIITAQAEPIGQFTSHQDIGKPKHPGSATYDAASGRYRVTGGGQNMWADRDDFHFVWKKMTGDVSIETDIVFHSPSPKPGAPGYVHRKGGVIIRQSLDTDSAYVDALRMGNQQMSLQTREAKGAQTHLIWINTDRQGAVRLEKVGDYATISVVGPDGKLRPAGGSFKVKITGTYYIGLAVCPHDDGITETMDFTKVKITPNPAKRAPGSTLQTMEVANEWEQTAIVHVAGSMTAPTWSADGQSFTYGKDGQLWRVTAPNGENSGEPVKVAGAVKAMAAPLPAYPSPDGKWSLSMAASPGSPDVELRLTPVLGGKPDSAKTKVMAKLVGGADTLGPQPWSPDSKSFAFVSH